MAMTTEKGPIRRSPALDGLRGLAILLVVGSHLSPSRLPSGGVVGVTLFFVLSGYLITKIALDEIDRTGRIDFRAFYVRRALRLLPALASVLLLTPLLLWALKPDLVSRNLAIATLLVIFYLGDFARAGGDQLVVFGHTWSLAIEEQFYLLWPVTLLLLTHRRRRFSLILVFGSVAALSIWRLAAIGLFGFDRIYFSPDTNAFSLLLGCAIAMSRYKFPVSIARFIGLSAIAVLVALTLLPGSPNSSEYSITLEVLAVPAAGLAAIVLMSVDSLGQVLSLPLLRFFGKISYSLYLWHLILLAIPDPAASPAVRAFSVVASVAVAAVSWHLIERPALRLKVLLENPKRASRPDETSQAKTSIPS